MKNFNHFDKYRREIVPSWKGDSRNGLFIIPKKDKDGYYQIYANIGVEWEHIAFCLLDNKKVPTGDVPAINDIHDVEKLFFEDYETAISVYGFEDRFDDKSLQHLWRKSFSMNCLPETNDLATEQREKITIVNREEDKIRIEIKNSANWKHLVISLLNKYDFPIKKYPSSEEINAIKNFYLGENTAIEIHSSEFSCANYQVHLWVPLEQSLTLPPYYLHNKTKTFTQNKRLEK
jgi:hypothetical protein